MNKLYQHDQFPSSQQHNTVLNTELAPIYKVQKGIKANSGLTSVVTQM